MSDTMNLNVRISGALSDYVTKKIKKGSYENISEYVRDLIRQDKKLEENLEFEALRNELKLAYTAPEAEYITVDAQDIFARNKPLNKP